MASSTPSSTFDERSAPPFHALVHGFPEHGSIAEVLGRTPGVVSCIVRRTERHGRLAVLRFSSLDTARRFRARWEGQRFAAASADRLAPDKGGADTLLSVRNAAQQLFAAALHGRREGVDVLLDSGVPADSYRDEYQCTPLHVAARCGAATIVRRLVDAGADLDAVSKLGRTPLTEASAGQHAEVVELLIAAGARVAHLDRWGRHAALAGVFVPERADGPWRNDADKAVAQMLLATNEPTAGLKREAVAHARLAAAAADEAGRQRELRARARTEAQWTDAARALDEVRRREVELRRAVDPSVPQSAAAAAGAGGADAAGRLWLARAAAQAEADARASAPGGAERLAARAAAARADETGRALWLEGTRGVNPETGRQSLYPHARPLSGAAASEQAHLERTRQIARLGAARADAIREAGVEALAARRQERTLLQLELDYANPLTGALAPKSFVQPANDLVWCERDGWIAKGVPRVNRTVFLHKGAAVQR